MCARIITAMLFSNLRFRPIYRLSNQWRICNFFSLDLSSVLQFWPYHFSQSDLYRLLIFFFLHKTILLYAAPQPITSH
jgi:hypothetical protein